MEFVALLVICLPCAWLIWLIVKDRKMEENNRRIRRENEEKAWNEVRNLTSSHMNTLVKKARQGIYLDDYGNEIAQGWQQEIDYFIRTVLSRNQSIEYLLTDPNQPNQKAIADYVDAVVRQQVGPIVQPESISPSTMKTLCFSLCVIAVGMPGRHLV